MLVTLSLFMDETCDEIVAEDGSVLVSLQPRLAAAMSADFLFSGTNVPLRERW